MDEVASSTLATLKKTSASAEAKIAAVNALKSSIKHQRVPEIAQATTLECLRLAITSQVSSSLIITGFSGLSHLVKRLTLQDQTPVLFSQRTNLLGILAEKLGDAKEAHRTAASQLLCDLWPSKSVEVERVIKETAIQGTHVRAKLEGISWVKKMHEEYQLQFKSFVAPIVECLEDADGTVRDAAKNNIVELFRSARDAAKADLRRQLTTHNVRKSIAEYILSRLQISAPSESSFSASVHPSTRIEPAHAEARLPDAQEPSLPPSAEVDHIEPLYVYTARELEDMFRNMQACFEDKESEHNWKPRDTNVLKIRRLLQGNAPTEHLALFVSLIKDLLDGILKVVNSLRTTMSTNGCLLLQEMAKTIGAAMEPMAEIILRGVEKMCAATKHIAAQNANTTVDTLLSHVPYSVRHMQHILAATADKNVQPRQFAAGWLKTVLKRQVNNKGYFEHSGGLEITEKCIKKGLADANPKVRELMRSTYWIFASSFPHKAEGIMTTLDPKSKQLLEKDQNNPNASKMAFTSSVGPEAATNPRASINARVSLKEAIAAQRSAARKLPDRPSSAMSSFTPVRQAPHSASRMAGKPPVPTQQRVPSGAPSHASSRSAVSNTSSSSTGQGSLMSAPIRRPRRPDVPRPFTADPYAGRNAIHEDSPPLSPVLSPHPASKSSSMSKASGHMKSKSTTTILGSNSGSTASSRAGSPKTSPAKVKPKAGQMQQSSALATSSHRSGNGVRSPSSKEENFTMVIPDGKTALKAPFAPPKVRNNENDRPGSGHSSKLGAIDEDNFTMVLPDRTKLQTALLFSPPHNDVPSGLEGNSTNASDRKDDAVPVYEDPVAEDVTVPQSPGDPPTVLEELPLNDQNLTSQQNHMAQSPVPSNASTPPQQSHIEDQNRFSRPRSAAPIKKATPFPPTKNSFDVSAPSSPLPDRAETLKTRRLLASGTERVRAQTLDAHGFRRLQDLIKGNTQNIDLQFTPLLAALVGYLRSSTESTASKEKALRGQALSCLRAVVNLYTNRSDDVRAALPSVLVGLAEAAAVSDISGIAELEKAGDDIVKRVASANEPALTDACINTVAEFVSRNSAPKAAQPHAETSQAKISRLRIERSTNASTALGLTILSRLTVLYGKTSSAQQDFERSIAVRSQLAALAVQCLSHLDPDVRRKTIDFAVELYALFPADAQLDGVDANMADGDHIVARGSEKPEFWKLLRPAGDQSCNLLTYYLARRGKVGVGA